MTITHTITLPDGRQAAASAEYPHAFSSQVPTRDDLLAPWLDGKAFFAPSLKARMQRVAWELGGQLVTETAGEDWPDEADVPA